MSDPSSSPAGTDHRRIDVRAGFASDRGLRPDNQDFGCVLVEPLPDLVIAVVADGLGGHRGGRVAAELAVRSFLEGVLDRDRGSLVERCSAALEATNRWIHVQGTVDALLERMATTLTALIIDGSSAFCIHVGDTRLYRLSRDRALQLTRDHNDPHPAMQHLLHRAVGVTATVEADRLLVPLAIGDRFLLCSDGIHGVLSVTRLDQILSFPGTPDECARLLIRESLAAGSRDNVTAIVLDILALPAPTRADLATRALALPLLEPPKARDTVDGYRLDRILADGRQTRVFVARDEAQARDVVIKFPRPRTADDARFRAGIARESWIAARVSSPWLGIPIDPGARRTRLYTLAPFYEGETLAARMRRFPRIGLAEGVALAMKLAKGLAALHRQGAIHRDVKPENVILAPGGGLRLIDFGIARLLDEDAEGPAGLDGTPSYLAPELFGGAAPSAASDLYALGVTLYTAFAVGAYPYGEMDPFTRPVFDTPTALSRHRPDLPAWLDAAILRLVAADPRQRYGDAVAFLLDLETGLSRVVPAAPIRLPLYQRNPARVWQIVSAALALLLWWALRH